MGCNTFKNLLTFKFDKKNSKLGFLKSYFKTPMGRFQLKLKLSLLPTKFVEINPYRSFVTLLTKVLQGIILTDFIEWDECEALKKR